jgi:hypothetical protein
MPRTTVDIDRPILNEIKALQKKERRSMGQVISQLLAEALGRRKSSQEKPTLRWVSRPMGALVDLSDKEAMYAALDKGKS